MMKNTNAIGCATSQMGQDETEGRPNNYQPLTGPITSSFSKESMMHQRFSPAPLTPILPRPPAVQDHFVQRQPTGQFTKQNLCWQPIMKSNFAPTHVPIASKLKSNDVDSARAADLTIKSFAPAPAQTIHAGYVPVSVSTVQTENLLTNDSAAIDDSIIEVATKVISEPQSSTPNSGRKSSIKGTKQYMLPDGSVAMNGKGLGRGRPGVKRGPRKTQLESEDSLEIVSSPDDSIDAQHQQQQQQQQQQQSTPVSNKRKRNGSDASVLQTRSASSIHSRESTPEYNPSASQTRSGRQTQKPTPVIAPVSSTASPAIKRQTSTSTVSTPPIKTHPKIKRKVYRGKEQFALCEHCTRGFGPPGNVIVFCDACNKCWHQKCHSPQIPKEVVSDAKAEWFCATCDKILHGKKVKKTSLPTKVETPVVTVPTLPPPPPPVQRYGMPLVGAQVLTLDQRRKYLATCSKDKLIGIILRAGDLAPNMPIFETPLPMPLPPAQQPLPQFASNYVTPVTETPVSDKTGTVEIQDEGYDDHFDEHATLYPKPGEGVQLPPDRVDLNMLLEGPESRTFSHWVRGMPMKTAVDTVALA